MKAIIIYILISVVISTICFSCTGGGGVSYGIGFGEANGPYGYGRYHPRINTGVYGGGYPRPGY